MIKDITIGQFFPGDSVIHRLDPRVKIVLCFAYIISIFFCRNFYSIGIMIALLLIVILLSRISARLIGKSVRPILIIICITSLLQIIYNKNGDVLFEYWKIKITTGGVYTAIFTTLRIAALVVASSMLTYTTSPTMLTDAIERLFSPLKVFKVNVHSIAMMMTIALRFIPTLIDEVDKIMSAQKSRGADFESGNITKRAKALIPIFIPLFINSFRRAYELAFAMECRCYRGGEGRTRLRVMKMALRDFAAFFVLAITIAGIFILNHYFAAVI